MLSHWRGSHLPSAPNSACHSSREDQPGPRFTPYPSRPQFTHGLQPGDVDLSSGMTWTRTDRPVRIQMEVGTTESFAVPIQLPSMDALPQSDSSVKRLVQNVPSQQDIFYRFTAHDLSDINSASEPLVGRFMTAPASRRAVRFAWSRDTAGKGCGISTNPTFFIRSGDTIYADGPMTDEVEKDRAVIWKNATLIDERRKLAQVLDEFRAQWKQNKMDRQRAGHDMRSARISFSGTTRRWPTTRPTARTCSATTATPKSLSTCSRRARRGVS